MSQGYLYPPSECDVADMRRLQAFRDKRALWLHWLDDDEQHAIWSVLSSMAWSDVAFATISKIALNDPANPLNSAILGEALIDGHVATQVLALRRLMDRRSDVISLPRLIGDVKKNIGLLTREHYVCFDGLPYDYEAAATRERAAHRSQNPRWLETTGPNAYGASDLMHQQFDRLSGVSPDARSRGDVIRGAYLDKIEAWLTASGADDIAQWSHAYLAHAGGEERRKKVAALMITNDKITAATKALAQVTEAISNVLYAGGRTGGGLLPVSQFDVFEMLQNPILPSSNRAMADSAWEERSRIWDHCLDDVRHLLFGQKSYPA